MKKKPSKNKGSKSINPHFSIKKKKEKDAQYFIDGIVNGNRFALSQAITLLESTQAKHRDIADKIIHACLPLSGNSVRIGITGTPGVGKSTFIESLGGFLIDQGEKLAVLAIDPSSTVSRGSILGDKTRMAKLSASDSAFIRPSPAGKSLGGVARKTRETMLLCEAAGFKHILVETVGVGQSETAVHSMVDFFFLLLQSGGGDELQGIKRGIIEMADMIAINKADGNNLSAAKEAKRAYKNALHLFPPNDNNWIPQVLTCSALEHTGIAEIWKVILDKSKQTKENGFFQKNRDQQALYWYNQAIQDHFIQLLANHPQLSKMVQIEKEKVLQQASSPFAAAQEIKNYLDQLLNQK